MKLKAFFPIWLLPVLITAQPDTDHFNHLWIQIDSVLKKYDVPGAQVAIVNRDTTLWLGNFGISDLEKGRPVTDETMFRIGSVTKSFIAVSVMMLVEEGKLKLGDKLKDRAPEMNFANPWTKTEPIRLYHLLEHTAGLDDFHMVEYAKEGKAWSTAQGLQFHPHSRKARWKPGKFMSYSNSGPPMAAYVVEQISGKTIETFLEDRIFQPLGMTSTSMLKTEVVEKRLSKGYKPGEASPVPYWHLILRPAGAINSNAKEMAHYVRFLLNDGQFNGRQLLTAASVQRMETPTSTLATKAGVKEGYGLHIQSARYKGVALFGHSGGMEGFLADMRYIPDLELGYVIFINTNRSGAISGINQAILQGLIPEGNGKLEREKTDIIPGLTGYYRGATSRQQLFRFLQWPNDVVKIFDREGNLWYQPLFGKETKLQAKSKGVYDFENRGHYSTPFVFTPDEKGRMHLFMPNFSGNYYRTSSLAVWSTLLFMWLWPLLMISAILSALAWVSIWLFGRGRIRNKKARVWPLLASIFGLGLMIVIFTGSGSNSIQQLGTLTPVSFSIFLLSLLFGTSSIMSLWIGIRSFSVDMHKLARIHAFAVGLSCFLYTLYLSYWGFLGIRTWVY